MNALAHVPVRLRLTAWYVGLLALVMAALAAFVVTRLRADLVEEIDRTLSSAAGQIAHGYAVEGPSEFRDTAAAVLPGAGSGAQVLDRAGRVVAAHGAAIARRPLRTQPGRATARLAGEDYRLLAVPVTRRGRRELVVVAQSLDPAEDAADRVLTLMLIAGPALLLAIAAGGWWLAGKALRPVGEMLVRLRGEVEERRRLIADASHELRTPLTAMRAEIDVALDDPALPAAGREVLESAREEVGRLTAIVNDLLTLARIDEGRLATAGEVVDLAALARDVTSSLSALADAGGVRLAVAGPPARVRADRRSIERALANLVDNAIKASPAGAEVTVALWRDGASAGLTVSDRGAGIPERARGRIFERFARVDEARSRRDGGAGLGLAICRELVEANGGRVTLESGPAGSTFSIALPAPAQQPSE